MYDDGDYIEMKIKNKKKIKKRNKDKNNNIKARQDLKPFSKSELEMKTYKLLKDRYKISSSKKKKKI